MTRYPQIRMIYVVDDDADVLSSLRFLLETDGFDVRTFSSGVGAADRRPLDRRGLLRDRLQDAAT